VEHLVSTEEMVGKLRAALDARRDENFVVIARCNASQIEGVEAALERAQAYQEAGADMLMIRARSEAEFQRISQGTTAPLASLASWTTKPEAEMLAAGYSLLMDPNSVTILTYMALTRGYEALKRDPFYGFPREEVIAARAEVQTIIGLEELYAIEAETTEKETLAELSLAGRKTNHIRG
jgi:methylisocitrate lyase